MSKDKPIFFPKSIKLVTIKRFQSHLELEIWLAGTYHMYLTAMTKPVAIWKTPNSFSNLLSFQHF